ncbi:zinc-binding dehydrogenase [Sandaracinus amylolyticus]|uniref:Alcohol dehydrogenase n=1 Tax=Sandaracinus amylolyticus TaxID=927083 RepID=A0A0F6W4I2_9BACT|nr:zinc-binding dehydrogenase [Sandaracinus amylolyticus]AKF07211.1 Alcohol dehydrogenase [Sandaracinus amylolyticus]
MKRVVVDRPGGYERLRVEAARDPEPVLDEVRVRVRASGVNYADCVIRMGLYESAKHYVGYPITPGFEVAGTIDAVGSLARDVAIGTEVIAVTRFGGYASHVVVPRAQIFAKPRALSFDEAASIPANFLTAHWALHGLAKVRLGETILVHSAAGGVGGALSQLGRRAGARVIGVVGRREKIDVARGLGCDAVIDASSGDWVARARVLSPRGYEIVLDANGASTLRASFELLCAPGRLVIYGFHSMLPRGRGRPSLARLARTWLATPRFDPLAMTGTNRSVLALNLSYLFEQRAILHEGMRDLLVAFERGELVAPPITCFALDDVASAHRALETGATVGKLVLVAQP